MYHFFLRFPSVNGIKLNDLYFFSAVIITGITGIVIISMALNLIVIAIIRRFKVINKVFVTHLILLIIGTPITGFYFIRWLKGLLGIEIAISKHPIIFLVILAIAILVISIYVLKYKRTELIGRESDLLNNIFRYVSLPIIIAALVLLMFKTGIYYYKSSVHAEITYKRGDNKNMANVILIVADSLSAKHIGLYGYGRRTTPNIDAFAKEAYAFTNMHANATFTNISIASLLTGKYPINTGVFSWYPIFDKAKRDENIMNLLKQHGYRVYAVTSSQNASNNAIGNMEDYLSEPEFRLWMMPFEDFWFKIGIDRSPFIHDLARTVRFIFNPGAVDMPNEPFDTAYKCLNNALIKRACDGKQPFFLYIHILEPHPKTLLRNEYKNVFNKDNAAYSVSVQQKYLGCFYKDDEQQLINAFRDVYDEMILYLDNQVGAILGELRRKEVYDNAIIIFTSDHGMTFRKNYYGTDDVLREDNTNVPLIIKVPYQKEGSIVDLPVQHNDIAPTILSILGLTKPSWMDGKNVFQKSKDDLSFTHNLPSARLVKFKLLDNKEVHYSPTNQRSIAMWKGDKKYVYHFYDNTLEVYNLKEDPAENYPQLADANTREEIKEKINKYFSK